MKYATIGATTFLFLLGLVWLVRSEGERNRAATREAAERIAPPRPAELADSAETVADSASEAAGNLLREVDRILGGPAKTAEDRSPATGRRAERTDARPSTKPDTRKPHTDGVELAAEDPLGNLFGDLFNLARETVRELDDVGQEALRLSPEEEVRTGREIHRAIGHQYRLRQVPRLTRLAVPLVPPGEQKKYQFFVMEREEPNAFAHVGGYVYMTSQALKVFDDLQLQFLIAHEIAHIHLGHTAQRITYAARAAELAGPMAGTATQLAYLAVALGYSQQQELEADAWAFRTVLALGHRRQDVLNALRQMHARIPKEQAGEVREVPQGVPQRVWYEIEDHLSSHPPFAQRIAALEALPAPDRR